MLCVCLCVVLLGLWLLARVIVAWCVAVWFWVLCWCLVDTRALADRPLGIFRLP